MFEPFFPHIELVSCIHSSDNIGEKFSDIVLLFGTKEVKKSREDSKLGPLKQLGILSENYVVLLTATCYEK